MTDIEKKAQELKDEAVDEVAGGMIYAPKPNSAEQLDLQIKQPS